MALARAFEAEGGRLFVIGGWVRDAVRGRQAKDLDLEVYGAEFANIVAEALDERRERSYELSLEKARDHVLVSREVVGEHLHRAESAVQAMPREVDLGHPSPADPFKGFVAVPDGRVQSFEDGILPACDGCHVSGPLRHCNCKDSRVFWRLFGAPS